MSKVITVENLGKKYILDHQSGQGSYVALRDVLSDGIRNLGRRLLGQSRPSPEDVHREEFWALKDVSFEVRQGDRIGIIGRNGAGKSTLLKILSRITEPTTGSVHIRGRVASLLEVGTGFHPELTGRENIYLNGAMLGMGRAEIRKKFDEIVAFAEVEQFLDTPVKRYSSGMYVRLAFAVAAHLEPEILVVDEVLAVGDVQFQKKCLGKMEDVSKKEGRTILFVSHNLGALQLLCTRALYLNAGEIKNSGDVAFCVNEYLKKTSIECPVCSNKILKSASIAKINQVTQGVFLGYQLVLNLSLELEDIGHGVDVIIKNCNKELFFAGSAYSCDTLITSRKCRLEVVLGPVNFAVGCYQIDVNIVKPTMALIEGNINVLEFEVHNTLPPNRFGFNLIADAGKSCIVLPQQWKVTG